ncbi:glycoside hydrolase family 3 protein [Desertimonas flava]|uniref:glycoside hydrolase family 3 protein n=1 Tax=Desertimonas flava TaxID=2064846 RepID=UPI000E344E5E|nr:glycoside hydrolase family 3 C-terminal domain-containing protein [Desertimonas flava]
MASPHPAAGPTEDRADARVAAVLDALTLEQKVALLAGDDTWRTASSESPPVPAIRMSDGPAGIRGTSWTGPSSASFPCGAALGATFDVELVREIGLALAREARTKSAHVVLGPTVNLQRTPVGGRNFECYSEDPVLTSEIAVAYVAGLQAEVPGRARVAACVKHLVANDTEQERMTISSEVDEATLREVYLPPFEAVVGRAEARAVMSAYNRLNGTFCSEHPWLLTTVLRDEWGFDGVVVSDWFGCHSAAESLLAGLDIEMPGPPIERGEKLLAAVAAGECTEADLDRAVARILALAEWVDAGGTGTTEVHDTDEETHDVIRRAAAAAMVLLKNERRTLPLPAASGAASPKVALIGPNAEFGRVQGGGSARVRAEKRRGPLEALRARGYDTDFETGGWIAKYLPVLHGDFTVEYFDDAGRSVTTTANRLTWYWDQPPDGPDGEDVFDGPTFGATITGTLRPDVGGPWEVGVYSVGPSAVRLDGEVVVAVDDGVTGGAFFGMGSAEIRATVELDAGREYQLQVDYPVAVGQRVRGLVVGARAVPEGDPIERAVATARAADVAVVIVGTDDFWETEGEDRTTISLPGRQDELVAAVAAANPNTVVVINAGSPVAMPWLDDVPTVLHVWFPGQELGDALADVLTAETDPGGRLPITFPRSLDETPAARWYPARGGKAVYGEGPLVGHRWYDRNGVEPLFPFGHGLSYTTFTIAPAGVTGSPVDGATVSVDVTNDGTWSGTEVVQVYVESPSAADPARPPRTLAGFAKVDLGPGESERVTIELPTRVFSRWVDGTGWLVEPGEYRVVVGRSSRDHSLAHTFEVAA